MALFTANHDLNPQTIYRVKNTPATTD